MEALQNLSVSMYLVIVSWVFGISVVFIFLWALLSKQFKNTNEMNHRILDFDEREYEGHDPISPLNQKEKLN
ncbi:MAG: cbb3-type cytochrome oxidase assembly protein CcoS [Bacteroidia bacterium]|nr:cbb3-type cytochrome oxidase assembly protein CcoS [Bacteroidia bacterium]MDW8346120.1 cbb3-type cytochrome oxidase assembly protein CcoS [Bacteroidia bacterium]